MLPRHQPDRIRIAFDDHRLVNNAGLILPATLALHLGLPQLVDRYLDLGRAPGRARRQDDDAGGICAGGRRNIDDADVLPPAGPCTLGSVVKAPSTLGPSCAVSGGGTSANWTG